MLPFEATTAALRASGVLIFAAAGNKGKNVDHVGCTFKVCFERTWYTPCENAGVICVGGTGGNSKYNHKDSNYGNKQVDIFAPFTLWLGPDPSSPTNVARAKNGTSYSSPFAAGVAALIWAADPSMSANQVETILLDTAHTSPDDKVRSYVNALGGVQEVFGNVPPNVTLRSPGAGNAPLNVPLRLSADVFDFEDAFPCCTVSWTSDVDGLLGNSSDLDVAFTTLGSRKLTVSATDKQGGVGSASVTLNIVNNAPTVEIVQPLDSAEVFRDAKVILRAQGKDLNEPNGNLACDKLTWTSSLPSDSFPVSGCEVEVVFSSNGNRTLTLTGTDPQGTSGSAMVSLSVSDPPVNLPPFVRVTSPEDLAPVNTNDELSLVGEAEDPEGSSDLTYAWTVRLENGSPTTVGTESSVSWTPSDTFDFSSDGIYNVEVRLSVTDPQGASGTDFVRLRFTVIN